MLKRPKVTAADTANASAPVSPSACAPSTKLPAKSSPPMLRRTAVLQRQLVRTAVVVRSIARTEAWLSKVITTTVTSACGLLMWIQGIE